MNIQEIWASAQDKLQTEVSAVSFELWIKSLEPIDLKNGILYLSTTSETAKQRILNLHKGEIFVAVTGASEDVKDFVILDPVEREAYKQNKELTVESDNKKFPGVNTFNSKYTFDNFVVGNSNKYVYAACRGVAEKPAGMINPLFIYGGVGLGKTHLLHAIGNYIIKNYPEKAVLYCPCDRFINDYVNALKGSSSLSAMNNFKEKYRNLDVLIIDDIQFISKAESTQEEFFHTFNELYENGKQIIIASDRPPKEIATLQERLRSRFSMGLIQDIQAPDYETRLAILMKKAQEEGYLMADEVMEYIAEHFDTNIRDMEGILSKVWFYARCLCKKSADMDDVREALKDHDFADRQNLTIDRIVDCVCRYYSLRKDDLLGKKKNREVAEPRQICMYVICELLNLPLMTISAHFGKKDHTTVIYARDKIASMIEEGNQKIKIAVNDIKAMAMKN